MTSHVPAIPPKVVHALRAARTPVCAYVYDRAVVLDQIERVRAALPAGADLYYAMKANGHPMLVESAVPRLDGLEVASGGELGKAVSAGAQRILFSGPAKTDSALTQALAHAAAGSPESWRLLINVESSHELRRLNHLARQRGAIADVALRVNRSSYPSRDTPPMGKHPSVFGIDEAELPSVAAVARELDAVRVRGLHLHAFFNNLDATSHAAYVREALPWSASTARDLGIPLEIVDVGGGIGIDYTNRRSFDLAAFAAHLPAVPTGLRVVFELGRYLAADSGWYAAEVIDLRRTRSRNFAVVRGGTHHFRLPAAWGYSHPFAVLPVERWPYPFPRPTAQDTEITIAGELCTDRDVLCRDQWVERLRVGDVVVFGRTGAYGWNISHHDFLAHDEPEFIVL